MNAKEIVEELRTMGSESIKKVLRNHGVREPFFRVKIGDMKKIQKRVKKDYQLALDLAGLKRLGERVRETIHQQPNDVRHAMNGFLIAVGTYVEGLSEMASRAAAQVGPVSVDMGNTACKVPDAVEYIEQARKKGVIGKNARP